MAKLLTGTRIYGTGTVDTQLFVNGTEQSISTTTGALEVVGGVGIGGNLFVGGISVLNGVQSTNIVASGTLGVTGTSTLGVVNATSATFSGTLGVTGTSILNGLSATNIVASGTLGITGTSTLAGLVLVTNTTSATSTNTGALQVVGGVGIGGDLRVGGIMYGTFSGSVTGTATTATNLAGGVAGQIPYQTAPGVTSFVSTGTAGNVLVSNGSSAPTYNNTLTLTGTTAAFSTNTGALQVRGGVGIGEKLYVGSELRTADNIFVGSGTGLRYITVNGADSLANQGAFISLQNTGFPILSLGNKSAVWGGAFSRDAGVIASDNLIFQTGGDIDRVKINKTGGEVIVYATSASISTSTGALQIVGGVGIGRSLFVQESIVQVGGTYSTLAATYNLINTTATTVNFAGSATSLTIGAPAGSTIVRNNLSVSGNLTVQGTTTIVDSTVTNIADPIITLGGGAGNSAPTVDDNKDRGIAFKWVNNGGTTSTGFFGYDDSTGFLTYIQTATITNEVVSGTKGAVDANLAGGAAMSLVYQSAANTTAFLPAGTGGFILQTNGTGSAPTWVSASGIGAGSATNSDAVRTLATTTNATYYPTFVDSNNATNAYESVYTTSSFVINPQSGNIGAGTVSPANKFVVSNGGAAGLEISPTGGLSSGPAIISYNRSGAAYTPITSYALNYAWYAGSAGTTRAVDIDSSGNVLVGTSTQLNTGFTNRLNVAGAIVAGSVSSTGGSIILQGQYGTGSITNFGTEYSSGGPVLSYGVYPSNTATGTFLSSSGLALTRSAYTLAGNSHNWYVGASQTLPIGSTATMSLAMTLNASGALAFNGATNYGTSGQVLQSNGNAPPTWVTIVAGGGTSTQVNTVLQVSNATYYPTFVDSNNASATPESVYTTSSFRINPSTGAVVIASAVTATSTTTGALQVVGGVGVGGDLYARDIYSNGTQIGPLKIQEFSASAGQTTFTVTGGYTIGTVQVFGNGVNLDLGDFTASNGTTVVVAEPRALNDRIKIISGGTISSANSVQTFSIAMSVALSM